MRKLSQIRSIRQNNKGSAIVTVVISMMFVITLGAALLFAAYTGYSIEITQRADKENLYDASAAMDDVRLGVQTLLSEATASAYNGVLTDYISSITSDPTYDAQADFSSRIIAQLLLKKTSGNVKYFTSSTTYKGDALKTFVDVPSNTSVSDGTLSVDGTTSTLTIKALTVTYTTASGFMTNITSDIVVTMPSFYARSSVSSSIDSFAIIANNNLVHSSGGAVTITGSVFVGGTATGITVSGNDNDLTFNNGDLYCMGPINVGDETILDFNDTTSSINQLWASEISVGSTTKARGTTLNGNIYVADDLVLNGSSKVTLKNTYFGFGNSTTSSDESSSIMVNGRGSTASSLSIDGLNKLSLAGISFINFGTSGAGTTNYSIPMGQAMSVKSDQLAYLVPAKCLDSTSSDTYATNPYVFESGETVTAPAITTSVAIIGTKTLANYVGTLTSGTTYSKCEIKTLYKALSDGSTIAYVFLVFNDTQWANAYFEDYFAEYPENIAQYLVNYLSLSDEADITNTAGNTYYTSSGLKLNPASDTVYATIAQTTYNALKLPANSPYTAFVNTTSVSALTSSPLLFKSGGNVVAVVAKGNYTYNGATDTIRLIIASGDVTVSAAFTGVIVAGGSVTVSHDVSFAALNESILNASCTTNSGIKLSDFILDTQQLVGNTSTAEDLWNLDSLVAYANWTKH